MNMDIYRIKSAMILYALEQSLGEYIIKQEDMVPSISPKVYNEVNGRSGRTDIDTPSMLIESSYIGEIFSHSLTSSRNTEQYSRLVELKSKCDAFDLFQIRNAVSHPVKQFYTHYYYVCIAIASDPLIDLIGLDRVKSALIKVENDLLEEPPEEWVNNVVWEIPNNLPTEFEHTTTSLIGRNRDMKALKTNILKPRVDFLSVVAPGGVGKTALTLEVLKELSLSPAVH